MGKGSADRTPVVFWEGRKGDEQPPKVTQQLIRKLLALDLEWENFLAFHYCDIAHGLSVLSHSAAFVCAGTGWDWSLLPAGGRPSDH